jgi:Flp pilus assembly protein CpaB
MNRLLILAAACSAAVALDLAFNYWRATPAANSRRDHNPMVKPTMTVVIARFPVTDITDQEAD